jgi:ribose transport system ATP-binding protein
VTYSSPDSDAQNGRDAPVRLRMTGIGKVFGGTHALRDVDFDVRAGEVHALLGENGAGKSTLINIISGVLNEYDGTVELDGEPVRFASPAAAQRHGVATVFQELDLVAGLTVADNLALGQEPRGPLWVVDSGRMERDASAALARVGSDIAPAQVVAHLRLGEQQAVMIAKALAQNARVLILDEPTAALTIVEVERLFALIREVAARGVAVIFVSHRLEEIPQIADRVTVLREGSSVGTLPPTAQQSTLVHLLTGRDESELFPPKSSGFGAPSLRLSDYSYTPRVDTAEWEAPKNIDLEVRRGEIVGLIGQLGAGRTELLETLAGAGPAGRVTGSVEVAGREAAIGSVAQALQIGIAYVPDDRRRGGFVPQRDVAENLLMARLAHFSRLGFLRFSAMRRAVVEAIATFGIKTESADVNILSLSGGNQQKVVIGRAIGTEPALLLLDEPTRGVDIGAKADIYRLIRSLTEAGTAVLIASSELPELVGLCDRIVVMRAGRVVAEPDLDTPPTTLMRLAQQDRTESIAS